MYKFFVDNEQIKENNIYIEGKDVNHIKNVLRLNKGEEICVCNKDTSENFNCIIYKIEKDIIICNIEKEILNSNETKTYIHIFQGLPKSDKLEFIIEKCTEIGVKEITPVIMKRTIVKINEADKIKKIIRWQKIAEVAAKQSKRDKILKINNVINFKNIFENTKNYDIVLIAYENETKNDLKKVLNNIKKENKNIKIAVIIGPEGGIDKEEIEICNLNNVIKVTLGKTILRTETAPLVISSNILYELED